MEATLHLREEMRIAALRAYEVKLQSGDGGNISVRVEGSHVLLIKSSGCSFRDLDNEENIVMVDFKGNILEGNKAPSREILSHIAIYQSRPDVKAIFHSHSPWSVTAAQLFPNLPNILLPLEMKIGNVPILDADENHANSAFASKVFQLLSANINIKAFIQRRHGLFCMSDSIIQAEHDAELVEDAAQIAVLSALMGK